MPFRGEHEVVIGPGVFALTAERDGDPRRSNAAGKSAFLWALRFVLTGDHPKRTEDEWLTDGEREGGVDIEFSDGAFASRWRTRGDATRLKVVTRDHDGIATAKEGELVLDLELHGDEAQAALDRIVGLSKTEQATTWWCEQGKADAFINGDPGDVTADVVRWCGVEPVRRAAKRVSDELSVLLRQEAKHLAVAEEARLALPAVVPVWDDVEAEQNANVVRLQALVDTNQTEAEKVRARLALHADAARHRVLEAEKKILDAAAAETLDDATLVTGQAKLDQLRGAVETAKTDLASKEKLSRGEFDGVCPVGGIACPAKDQLNADASKARILTAAARKSLNVIVTDLTAATVSVSEMRTKQVQAAHRRARLDIMGPELTRLKPARDAVDAMTNAELAGSPGTEPLHDKLTDAVNELADTKRQRAVYTATVARKKDAELARNALVPDIIARREALQILGPSGAQRQLVDDLLLEVEAGANEDLASSGVDLVVEAEWQRELKDPAVVCPNCGQPFPASTKVKACEHCGAPRGRKLEQKLRFIVTPKSGGMDALAGIGVRLAALAWLKEKRSSGWSVVALDEPLAHVDVHNRMLVGRHLVAILGSHYGIEQAFVSAHDPALLAALPRRIIVKAGANGSTIEVM